MFPKVYRKKGNKCCEKQIKANDMRKGAIMRKLALSDEILLSIDKPARYIGNEVNAVMKSKNVDIRFAMCFPDVYGTTQ